MCRLCGGLLHREADADMRVLTPLDHLTHYQWHSRTAKDYICPTRGIQPFRRPRTAAEQWSVNVRCLDGVDLSPIPVKHLQGSRLA
jgi:hypothetical protein